MFGWAYTIVDYKLEQYFSLTPNQPNQPAVNNPRSFTTKRTGLFLVSPEAVIRVKIATVTAPFAWRNLDEYMRGINWL